jgi:cytochrome c biogenesis protein CcdA
MAVPVYSADIVALARRRRMRRVWLVVMLGIVVAGYTYGALAERVIAEDRNDLLPQWLEAVLLGTVFALASLPSSSAILARIFIPVPTFLLYITVLTGKNPPLPNYAAFTIALAYAAALTVLSAYLAEVPERSRLGSRR